MARGDEEEYSSTRFGCRSTGRLQLNIWRQPDAKNALPAVVKSTRQFLLRTRIINKPSTTEKEEAGGEDDDVLSTGTGTLSHVKDKLCRFFLSIGHAHRRHIAADCRPDD